MFNENDTLTRPSQNIKLFDKETDRLVILEHLCYDGIMNYQESLQVNPYWLPQVEESLRLEGFGTGPQIPKPGQCSGWIKALQGGYQLHVRLFSNGIIQPEHEVHWQFFEHPGTSWPAIDPMTSVLDEHRIPYQIVYTKPYTVNSHIPASRTPWLGTLAVVVLGLVLITGLASQQQ